MSVMRSGIVVIGLATLLVALAAVPSNASDPDEEALQLLFDEWNAADDIDFSEDEGEAAAQFVEEISNATLVESFNGRSRSRGWRKADNFQLPSRYSNIKHYCNYLGTVPDRTLSQQYENAFPLTGNMPHGCNPGCIVGSSLAAGMNRGPQGPNNAEWIGKCFYPEQQIVKNQIRALPWYAFNLIDPVVRELYEAQVYVDESWFNQTEQAVIIDYSMTPPAYGKSFRCYRDEFREVSPGFFLGKLYAKPFSYCDYLNPLPYPYWVLHFAIFQTPQADGESRVIADEGASAQGTSD